MSTNEALRLLILGAHPDDAEFHAGGLAAIYRQLGHTVKMVSVTDGGAGHHQRGSAELVVIRRAEAEAAGRVIGARYETWAFPDGSLEPTMTVRHQIIREIRAFAPDLLVTHRTCDYHPDHRAVGQAVQDASYMVTVPLILPEVKPLRSDPVIAYMADSFTRPCPFRPDVTFDVAEQLDTIIEMLACHHSQVFEFLPYNHQVTEPVPDDETERKIWLRRWFTDRAANRAERFREQLVATYGAGRGNRIEVCEAYEISEYAAPLDDAARRRLFPFVP